MERNYKEIESKNLLIEFGDKVDESIRKAVNHALLEHKRAGNSVAVWRNGRVVIIQPENIILDKV